MASLPILTAVSDTAWEVDFVAAVERSAASVNVIRRCVDVADLLAAASTGAARAVVLSAGLRRLDASTVSRLRACGLHIVALIPAGDEPSERRIRQLGVGYVLPVDAPTELVIQALESAERSGAVRPTRALGAIGPVSASSPPPGHLPASTPFTGQIAAPVSGPSGGIAMPPLGNSTRQPVPPQSYLVASNVIAVWGPTGAPGRTTIALGVADEAARAGISTLLIDADSYGGVIAQHLGMLDEAPGIAAAARAHHHGALDVATLASYARQIDRNLSVLTGISRADRWPELRGEAVVGVLDRAKQLAKLVVVDCGFCLEDDEELSYDTAAPRRNAAALAALGAADRIVAVGSADPVGVARLVRGLVELGERVDTAAVKSAIVVMNRLRRSAMPGDPVREVSQAMQRFAGVGQLVFVPYDRDAADRAVSVGRTLAEVAPRSPLRTALAGLTVTLLSADASPPQLVSGARA